MSGHSLSERRPLPAGLVKVRAGSYRTTDGRYEVLSGIEHKWEIWQTAPTLGVYEGRTLRECIDWLGLR